MKDYFIAGLIDDFNAKRATARETVRRLVEEGGRGKDAVRHFVEKYRFAKTMDWHYQYTDDADVYRSAEERWADTNAKAAVDSMLALALTIVGKEVHESTEPVVTGTSASWESTSEVVDLDGRKIQRSECAEINYGFCFRKRLAYMEEDGTILLIEPPRITKEMVIDAASNGMPVVKWHDWHSAVAYADSEEFYGWRLLVRPYNRDLTKGAIFVVPTITDTRRIHRAGKIKHIAQISGQPLIWAKSYYNRCKKVKYAIEDRVVEKVANYSGSTYEEWQKLPEDNSRARAVKKMVALINQFEGA